MQNSKEYFEKWIKYLKLKKNQNGGNSRWQKFKMVTSHMGTSKHTRASKHMGAFRHTGGASKHMGASKQTGGASKHMGHSNIQGVSKHKGGIQTYGWCPNI